MEMGIKYLCLEYLPYLDSKEKRAWLLMHVYLGSGGKMEDFGRFVGEGGYTNKKSKYYCGTYDEILEGQGGWHTPCEKSAGNVVDGKILKKMCKSCIFGSRGAKSEEMHEWTYISGLYNFGLHNDNKSIHSKLKITQVFIYDDNGKPFCLEIPFASKVDEVLRSNEFKKTGNFKTDTLEIAKKLLSKYTLPSSVKYKVVRDDVEGYVRMMLSLSVSEPAVNKAVTVLMSGTRISPKKPQSVAGQLSFSDIAPELSNLMAVLGNEKRSPKNRDSKNNESSNADTLSEMMERELSADNTNVDDAELPSDRGVESPASDETAAAQDARTDAFMEARTGFSDDAERQDDAQPGSIIADAGLVSDGSDVGAASAAHDASGDHLQPDGAEDDAGDAKRLEGTAPEAGKYLFSWEPSKGIILSSSDMGFEVVRLERGRFYKFFSLIYNSRFIACEPVVLDGEHGFLVYDTEKFKCPVFVRLEFLDYGFIHELVGTDKYLVVTVNYELLAETVRSRGYTYMGNVCSIGAAYHALYESDEIYPFDGLTENKIMGLSGCGNSFGSVMGLYVDAYANMVGALVDRNELRILKRNQFYEYVLSTANDMSVITSSNLINLTRNSYYDNTFGYQPVFRVKKSGTVIRCHLKDDGEISKYKHFKKVFLRMIFKRDPFDRCGWSLLYLSDTDIAFFVNNRNPDNISYIRERVGVAVADTCKTFKMAPITFVTGIID